MTAPLFIARQAPSPHRPGFVHILNDALESLDWPVGIDVPDALEAVRRAPGAAVFVQTEGALSPSFRQWAEEVLERGATVLELNTFALPSPWRPVHPRYRMILLSVDGLHRYRLRSAATPGRVVPRAAIVGHPLVAHDTSEGGADLRERLTEGREAVVLSRIGRPDPRKWTSFEIDVSRALASAHPERRFVLHLVGAPGDLPVPPVPSNLSVVRSGYLEQVGSVYAASDVYLHRSHIGETYGMTIYEAACHGLRVVVGLDLAWDAAPVEFLDDRHAVATPRVLEGAARQGRLPLDRPGTALRPKPLETYLEELLELAGPAPGLTPVPTLSGSVRHLRRLAERLGAPAWELPGAVLREQARAARRWAAARLRDR